jgi:hypothetical protein
VQAIAAFLVQVATTRSKKCGDDNLKKLFDMIHEQGYNFVLQGFPSQDGS